MDGHLSTDSWRLTELIARGVLCLLRLGLRNERPWNMLTLIPVVMPFLFSHYTQSMLLMNIFPKRRFTIA